MLDRRLADAWARPHPDREEAGAEAGRHMQKEAVEPELAAQKAPIALQPLDRRAYQGQDDLATVRVPAEERVDAGERGPWGGIGRVRDAQDERTGRDPGDGATRVIPVLPGIADPGEIHVSVQMDPVVLQDPDAGFMHKSCDELRMVVVADNAIDTPTRAGGAEHAEDGGVDAVAHSAMTVLIISAEEDNVRTTRGQPTGQLLETRTWPGAVEIADEDEPQRRPVPRIRRVPPTDPVDVERWLHSPTRSDRIATF